jgi:DNA-binding transcriptional ArsR family regulator
MADDDADVFAALAHPTRRRILQDLIAGELAAGEIASRFDASGPTISRHLGVLRQAGLVGERRDANRILYSLEGARLRAVVGGYLGEVCGVDLVPRAAAVGGGAKPPKRTAAGKPTAAAKPKTAKKKSAKAS